MEVGPETCSNKSLVGPKILNHVSPSVSSGWTLVKQLGEEVCVSREYTCSDFLKQIKLLIKNRMLLQTAKRKNIKKYWSVGRLEIYRNNTIF